MMAYPAMARNSGLLHSFPFVFFIFKTDCWLHWVFATAARLSKLQGVGVPSPSGAGPLVWWLPVLQSTALGVGCSAWDTWA